MSPLFLVGITLLTTLSPIRGDVSHVLAGSAHPPANPIQINNAFQSGNPQDFWWMRDGSPLKASYEFYKKCSGVGKCPNNEKISVAGGDFNAGSAGGNFAAIDVSHNVFLNGDFAQGKAQASAGVTAHGNKATSLHNGVNVDLSKNPFLKGEFATAANGDIIRNENGFIGVQPSIPFKGSNKKGFSTTHPLDNKKPFATTHPLNDQQYHNLGQNGASASGSSCYGNGRICVPKEQCHNGVVKTAGEDIFQVRSNNQICSKTEICCTLPDVAESNAKKIQLHLPNLASKTSLPSNINDLLYTAGKSSVPGSTIKFNGGAGISPGQIQILSENSVESKPEVTFHGESSVTLKPTRDISAASASNSFFASTPDYSNVKFDSDVRFASDFQGPDYLPPLAPSTERTTCGPGQYYTPQGTCEPVAKPCPFGTRRTPSGGCEQITPSTPKPSCGPGQILNSAGQCSYPPPPPTQRPTCRPGQVLSPSGQCSYPPPPPTTPRPTCGPGQVLSPSGQCSYPPTPRPTCGPGQVLSHSGQCSYPPPPPTTPRPTCGPGQVLSPSGQCSYPPPPPTPRPSCGPGQIINSAGQCAYPPPPPTPRPTCGPGQVLSPSGQCSYPPPPTTPRPTCGPGQLLNSAGQCAYPPPPTTPKPTCGPGQVLSPSGQCAYPPPPTTPRPTCRPGQVLSPSGQCSYPPPPPRPSCGPGQILNSAGQCAYPPPPPTPRPSCRPGQVLSPSGQCSYPPTPTTPRPSCGPGQILNSAGQCAYPPPPPTSRPTCGPGQVLSPSGQCSYPPTPTTPRPTCGPGLILSSSGQCISVQTTPRPPTTPGGYDYPKPCPPGTIKSASGECIREVTITPKPECPSGSFPTASGSCQRPTPPTPPPRPICPSGSYIGPSGNCERPPAPATCAPGTIKSITGECIRQVTTTPRPTCPPGSFPSAFGGCQKPTSRQPQSCPPGTVKTPYGSCETPSTPIPRPCPPGSYLGSSGTCERPPAPPTTPQPCPPGTVRTPTGQCLRQPPVTSPRPPPSTTSREYLPPIKETKPAGYNYPKPTPPFELPIPPRDEVPDSSNNTNVYRLPPTSTTPPTHHAEYDVEGNPPVGCAAALKCVQEIYCTAEGFVSPVPVVLTKEQELLRAPTTTCLDRESGIVGKCCRDPNYKDPWPSANLVNGIDDGQYKEDDSIGQYKGNYQNNRLVRSHSKSSRTITRQHNRPARSNPRNTQPVCGDRHYNTQPLGPGPLDANFAEIPWQAMILKESNRSLLCGGVILQPNVVLTAAHCVEGQETSDVLIKGGEWKLGIDEEPLPFQIVKVAAILRHPGYQAGSFHNDLALLILEEKLRLVNNVGTICLPEPNQIPTQNCIATGWGKRILQLHARGAIMHKIDVNIMDNEQCKKTIEENFQNSLPNHSPNTLCGYSDINQCKVDYGSALACANENGQYILSGIYSWDTGCKTQGQIGGYVAPDVDWIEDAIEKPLKELKRLDRQYHTSKQ